MLSIKLEQVLKHLEKYPTDQALRASRVTCRIASFVVLLVGGAVAYVLGEQVRAGGGSNAIYLALTLLGVFGLPGVVALNAKANLSRIIPDADLANALIYAENSPEARAVRDAIVRKGRSVSVFDLHVMHRCSEDAALARLRKVQSAGIFASRERLHTVSPPTGDVCRPASVTTESTR